MHTSAGFVLSVTDGNVVEMTYYGGLNHKTASAYHEAFTTGIRSVVGVEPTAEYIKQKLEISDTTIENGTIKFSPVTVENKVLLWENPKPSEAFTAQTVSVPNLGNYDTYSIIFKTVYSESITNEDTFRYLDGGGYLRIVTSGGTGRRYFTKVDSGLSFVDASYSAYTATTASTSNGYAVPIAIYGIKNNPTVNIPSIDISSAGLGGDITLTDSRQIQKYLSLKNKTLWSGDIWNSGTKTIPGISNYQILQCYFDLNNSSCILIRNGTNKFVGGINTPYPTWVGDIAIELAIEGDNTTVTWEWISNAANGTNGTINKTYGPTKIIGLEPTEEYIKSQLELNDTTIENGKVKFKPVDVKNRTLLWTNPDFSAATFAKQTIDVPWQDYDTICVEYAYNPSGSKPYKDSCTISCPAPGGSSVGHLEFLWLTTAGASNGAERYFTIKDGGIEFDTGWYGANNAAASIHNEFCVPLYIYGIKNKVTVDIPEVDLNGMGPTVDPNKVVTLQKVWTNASPTSSFAAQKIDIDTSDADFVVIVERYSTTSGSSEVFTIIPSMGGYLRTFAGAGYSTTGYCSRYVEFTSSQIKFGDNYLKSINTTTGGTVNNTYQIPTEIYTLKGVL